MRRTWPLGGFLRGSGACAAERSQVWLNCTRGSVATGRDRGRPARRAGYHRTDHIEPEHLNPDDRPCCGTRPIDAEAPQYNASLVRREDMTESLAYFWVRFDGEPTPFEAGQYMTIGVMVDGRIVQRPYSVASPPVVAGTEGYEFYVRSVQGGTVHAAALAAAAGPQDADDRPEGQVHAASRRRPHAHLHLVRDRQRTVRLDDAPGPGRRHGAPRRVPQRRVVRAGARLQGHPRGLGAHRRVPGDVHPDRSRARTIPPTPGGWAGQVASR